MSRLSRFLVLLGFLLGFAAASPSGAQVPADETDAARTFIADLSGRAIAVLRDESIGVGRREAVFRDMLREGFDLDYIGRFVLGRHWNTATPAQREEYRSLFGDYVLKTYSVRLGGYAGEQFLVTGAQTVGKRDIMVKSRIVPGEGPAFSVDWRVRSVNGAFRIVDVVVEELSMSLSQRQEFSSVVQSKGMTGLIEALRARASMAEPVAAAGAGG